LTQAGKIPKTFWLYPQTLLRWLREFSPHWHEWVCYCETWGAEIWFANVVSQLYTMSCSCYRDICGWYICVQKNGKCATISNWQRDLTRLHSLWNGNAADISY